MMARWLLYVDDVCIVNVVDAVSADVAQKKMPGGAEDAGEKMK